MAKDFNIASKTVLKAFLFICFVGSVYLLSQILSYFNSGADPKNILNLSKDVYSTHTPSIKWEKEEAIVGLKIDKYEKLKIEENYLLAWHMMNLAFKENNLSQLKDFFSDSLLVTMEQHLSATANLEYEQIDLEHNIFPKFHAIDKQLLVIEDKCVLLKKRMINKSTGEKLYEHTEYHNYKVAMSLDDGRWRIQHMERRACEECGQKKSVPIAQKYTVDNKQFYVNNQTVKVHGINYYPAKHPWSLFWKNFELAAFQEDIELMRNFNFNAVRIFIPFVEFGGANPKIDYLLKLNKLLDELDKNNMMAVVTLFDYPQGFSWDYYTRTDRHLEKILKHCKAHPAILAFDLKNEPDLDIELYGAEVKEWLAFVLERSKQYAPENLFTIGWSSPETAIHFADSLDFVSFHYYKEVEGFLPALKSLSFECQDKLLVVSEFGFPSYEPSVLPISKTVLDQQSYVAGIMKTIDEQELPYFFWTLHDFPKLPSDAFSIFPWRRDQQKHFGMMDTVGVEKPVAQIFKKRDFQIRAQKNPIPKYVKNWIKIITILFLIFGALRFFKSKFRPS